MNAASYARRAGRGKAGNRFWDGSEMARPLRTKNFRFFGKNLHFNVKARR
jgi:hypothetical protein